MNVYIDGRPLVGNELDSARVAFNLSIASIHVNNILLPHDIIHMVYFIQNREGHIKIGSSSDVDRRVLELQTANSGVLRILYVIDIPDNESLSFEQHTQGVCGRYALQGEWFSAGVISHLLNHPWYKEHMRPVEVPMRILN